jgi:hypothetical protein
MAERFPRLNGKLPERCPGAVPSGTAPIEKNNLWMSKNHGIVMVVLSVHETQVVCCPNGTPGEGEHSVPIPEFRERYIPWDLVPD